MAASALVMVPGEVRSPASFLDVIPAVEAIQIYLATLEGSGSVIPMTVLTSDTIASVKLRIQACKGFHSKQQRLVYGRQELRSDDCLIKDYGVSNGEYLHLVLRLPDLVNIQVKTVNGNHYVIKVERSKRVRELKQRISEKEGGLGLNEQQLVFKGKNLKDQWRLDEILLKDDAVVHLFVRRTLKVRTLSVGKDVQLSVIADDIVQVRKDLCETVSGDLPFTPHPKYIIPQHQPNFDGRYHVVESGVVLEPVRGILQYPVPDVLVDILAQAKSGLQNGHHPVLTPEGSGGTYFLKGSYGINKVAVFKPVDEEPMAVNNPRGFSSTSSGAGLKSGTRFGVGAMREVAAYLLDHPVDGRRYSLGKHLTGFSGIPPTMMVRCAHDAFHYAADNAYLPRKAKLGSLQQFVHALSSCEDMGFSKFPVEEVHKIAVLDMRLANTDRNGANILVCREENNDLKLVPIDHGYCLPENLEELTFEWLYWSQARVPFSLMVLKYIASLDVEEDIQLLSRHGWSLNSTCARVFRISTMLLKKGAAAGLTPFAIGSMICRENLDKKSPIEEMISEAQLMQTASGPDFMTLMSRLMDRYIEMVK